MKETPFFYTSRRFKENCLVSPVGIPKERGVLQSIYLQRVVRKLDDYLLRERLGINKKTLGEDQIAILQSNRDCLADGMTDVYSKAPVGYGKTLIYAKLADALGLKTLILVPTTILLNQVANEISECTEGLGVGKIYQGEKVYDQQVTVATYDSFLKGIENGSINPKDYGCLILDEGHRALTKRRKAAVARLSNAIKFGYSATPDYSEKKQLKNLLPTKTCDISLRQGIENGRLANAKGFLAMVIVDDSNKTQDKRSLRVNALMRAALNFYLNHSVDEIPIKGQRTLISCERIKDAEALAKLFREHDIASEAITGRDSIKNKNAKIARFKSGETTVGTTVDLLGTGYDDKDLKVCLFIRNTFSSVNAEQRMRNLRKRLNDKDKLAILVDFFVSDIFEKSKTPISSAAIVNGTYTVYDVTPAILRRHAMDGNEKESPNEVVVFEALDISKKEQAGSKYEPIKINTEQILEITHKTDPDIMPKDIVQWKTFTDMAVDLKMSEEILWNILSERGISELNRHGKNWRILETVNDTGRLVKRLSPPLVDWLRETIMEYKTFPIAGGKCVNDIVKELRNEGYKINNAMVTKSFVRIGRENLDEAGVHKHPKTRKYTRYLSAVGVDLVRKDVIENILKYPPPPKDSITITRLFLKLKKRYGARYEAVKSKADILEKEDSRGFGLFRSSTYNWNGGVAGVHRYVSLEKAARIEAIVAEEYINKPPFPPQGEGWKSAGDFRKETGVHDATARKRAEVFRDDHPEWFHVYSNNKGRNLSEHWHPLLQAELKKIFGISLAREEALI
ncbi:MAG: hypothetical protein A3H79_02095 [Candidatus Levybacteria bacterium RIFCSPLOWO2_02_FULL_36_8b]|nr:MAG: hypothetical protein A3H79_02095 [Candidatus Levybacteria bacterium RIFCSPLOWO2_02_FULL_36_8b]